MHARGRPAARVRIDAASAAVRGTARAIDDGNCAAVGVRPVSYRSGRFGFSADHVAALERQGYLVESSVAPLFYESHKGGPEFVEAPLTPYFLAYDSATTGRLQQLARSARQRGAEPLAAQATPVRVRAGASAVHDQASAPRPRTAAAALVAAVVFVAGRHDEPGARPGAPRRAGAQSALSLERGDRRRQSVQSHPGRARRVLRSTRAVSRVCDERPRRQPVDVCGVPRSSIAQ